MSKHCMKKLLFIALCSTMNGTVARKCSVKMTFYGKLFLQKCVYHRKILFQKWYNSTIIFISLCASSIPKLFLSYLNCWFSITWIVRSNVESSESFIRIKTPTSSFVFICTRNGFVELLCQSNCSKCFQVKVKCMNFNGNFNFNE